MGDKSAIEWTDATWNPVTGCSKVSQGCKNCYAKREWPRLSANPQTVYFGREFEDVRVHPERLDQPLHWARPRRIFVNSMSDLFHPDVPFAFIDQIFGIASICGQHQFQILTKRPEVARAYFLNDPVARAAAWNVCACAQLQAHGAPEDGIVEIHARKHVAGYAPRNCQIGVSVEDQATADERIPVLCDLPARIRFLSVEPLLAPVVIDPDHLAQLHWVIVGGESGPRARPTATRWVRDLRDQCEDAQVPFFFKQWGEWVPFDQATEKFAADSVIHKHIGPESLEEPLYRVGKKRAGRLLDGRTHDAMPAAL